MSTKGEGKLLKINSSAPFSLGLVLTLLLSAVLTTPAAFATFTIQVGSPCSQTNQVIASGSQSLKCVLIGNRTVWSSTPLFISPPVLNTTNDPHLNCDGTGEVIGIHPGWKDVASQKLTIVAINNSNSALYWCPATAPNGAGAISYTVTSTLGAITCETTATNCVMQGISPTSNLSLMATDETGSYPSFDVAVQNSGVPNSCIKAVGICNPGAVGLTFPTYGNVAPTGVGNCTFAAVANWEQIALGLHADPVTISSEFKSAGGTPALGLTNEQVFNYWSTFGIAGVFLRHSSPIPIDPVNLKRSVDDPNIRAVIVSLNLNKNQNFAGTSNSNASYHWVVVNGYTPQGPLVVTWGQRLQMTWQQWNLEAVTMWSLNTGNALITL